MKRIKLDTVQREIIILVISFFICLIIFFGGRAGFLGGVWAESPVNENEGIIRLHVIGNSNSQTDQDLKLKVRDAIISNLDGQKDIDQCRQYIQSHLSDIAGIADEVIRAEGFDYKASAELGVFFIPRKTYEDLTLPAGNYEALRIVLGEGKGRNWWCVIFPNLCLIDSSDDDNAPEDTDRLILKSKIKEEIRNIYHSRHI